MKFLPLQIFTLYSLGYFQAIILAVQLYLIGDIAGAASLLGSLFNPLCIYVYDHPSK